MMAEASACKTNWVVLKFGGTSVASAERWAVIVEEVRRAREAGERPCVVVSAVSQVTNRLNKTIEEALSGIATTQEDSSFQWIKNRHFKLAEELGIALKEAGMLPVREILDELQRILDGISLTREASTKLIARICAFGELMSSQLGMLAIQAAGCPCVRIDARRVIKSTETATQQDTDRFLNANVNPVTDVALVEQELKDLGAASDSAIITQGFIASTPKNFTCILGRGGSDTSGALVAALLNAKRLEIWTDVHGLFTSDPRHVKHTRLIRKVNYRVAQELASMGAKVLHPRCLVPALWASIPVEVHNTMDPKGPCTLIEGTRGSFDLGMDKADKITRIMAVTERDGQVLINITNLSMWGEAGFLSRVFLPFGELDVSVDLVATSQYAVSLTLDHIPGGVNGEVFARLQERLKTLGKVTVMPNCAVVSVVGEHLRNSLSELGKSLSEALADLPECDVHLMTQSSEDLNLSWVVDEHQARELVQGLHNRLFPPSDEASACERLKSDEERLGQTWERLKTPEITKSGLKKSWSDLSIGSSGSCPSSPEKPLSHECDAKSPSAATAGGYEAACP